MLGGLWFNSAWLAGCVRVLVEPGGVGGQPAFCRSHLVDPSCHKLSQTHEPVQGEGRGIVVIWGSGRIGGPVLEGHVSSVVSEGLIGFSHELGGGIFVPGRGGAWRTRGKNVRPS